MTFSECHWFNLSHSREFQDLPDLREHQDRKDRKYVFRACQATGKYAQKIVFTMY